MVEVKSIECVEVELLVGPKLFLEINPTVMQL